MSFQILTTNCDGFAIANSSSSYPPITYLWDDGTTQNNLLNLCQGIYSVIINDSAGSFLTDTAYIGIVLGCTDSSAFNFNPSTTVDDGSCVPFVYGCTDSTAFNYFPLANM